MEEVKVNQKEESEVLVTEFTANKEESNHRTKSSDFEFLTVLGQGAYGQVYLVQYKKTKKQYALKVIEKNHIIKYDKIESVFRERKNGELLSGHPNTVQFEATF